MRGSPPPPDLDIGPCHSATYELAATREGPTHLASMRQVSVFWMSFLNSSVVILLRA